MSFEAGTTPRHDNNFTYINTSDVDEHAACLGDWRQRYDQLAEGAFSGTFEECWFNRLHLFRESLNKAVHQTGEPWPGSRTFAIPVSLSGTGWLAGETFGRDSIITLGSGDQLDFRTPRRVDYVACSAESSVLNEYALLVEHRDLEADLQGRTMLHARAQQAETLRALLSTAIASLRAAPDIVRNAHIRTALEQGVLASLVDVVSPLTETVHTPPSFNTRQLVVQRARDYVLDQSDEPVTVADLCIKLRVSRRTLQYSFHDVFGLSPAKFLRAIRLNAVRRELKDAEPTQATVADIAAHWAFWHLSHFAAEYKAMFGELPSETLKKAW